MFKYSAVGILDSVGMRNDDGGYSFIDTEDKYKIKFLHPRQFFEECFKNGQSRYFQKYNDYYFTKSNYFYYMFEVYFTCDIEDLGFVLKNSYNSIKIENYTIDYVDIILDTKL